jgi:phage terminase small subunit
MAKLTAKQSEFVRQYLIDLCGAKAAIRAGYSKRNADNIASELLGKTQIKLAVDAAIAKRAEKTGIDALWILKRLAAEANADIADLYDESGCVKSMHEWPLVWRQGLVAGVDVEEVPERGGRIVKIRFSDRVRRLEMLGKHVNVNAFRDQVHHTGLDTLGDRLARAKRRGSEDR